MWPPPAVIKLLNVRRLVAIIVVVDFDGLAGSPAVKRHRDAVIEVGRDGRRRH
jgi:hypothetical protein